MNFVKNIQNCDHKQENVKRWEDAKCATQIESLKANPSRAPELLQEQVRNEKSADHEEHSDALAAMAERGIERNSIQKRRFCMSQNHDKD